MLEGKERRKGCDPSNPRTETDRSNDANKAFALYATLNWPFGLWPLHRIDLNLKIRFSIGIVQMVLMMSGTFHTMYQNCGATEDSMIDNFLVITSGFMCLTKLMMYYTHREKFRTNVLSAIDDWSSTDTTNYRGIMKSHERLYKKITLGYIGIVGWCASLHILRVLVINADETMDVKHSEYDFSNVTRVASKRRYLFPSACTLHDVPETLYYFLFLNQFAQIVVCCVLGVGCDAFFLAMIIHLHGQFEILKKRFASIGEGKHSHSMENREDLTTLIPRHQCLLHLVNLLEVAYNKIVLAQLLVNVTIVSIAGFSFLVALKTRDSVGSVKSLGLIFYMLLQSLMYSCIGESLHTQGDSVTQSIYGVSWYKLPKNLSKDLVFVMMRSNVSPHLTAGKFFNMTRSTFMDVVKTSSSYLSILRIMLKE